MLCFMDYFLWVKILCILIEENRCEIRIFFTIGGYSEI